MTSKAALALSTIRLCSINLKKALYMGHFESGLSPLGLLPTKQRISLRQLLHNSRPAPNGHYCPLLYGTHSKDRHADKIIPPAILAVYHMYLDSQRVPSTRPFTAFRASAQGMLACWLKRTIIVIPDCNSKSVMPKSVMHSYAQSSHPYRYVASGYS